MSPGSVRLAGNIPDGEGLIYYVVCSSHGEVEERRSLGVSCPMGHVPKQVKVRLRCPTCRWVDRNRTGTATSPSVVMVTTSL